MLCHVGLESASTCKLCECRSECQPVLPHHPAASVDSFNDKFNEVKMYKVTA